MRRYIAAALLACHTGAAIAQDFKGEYCAGVNAFDNQAHSQLLNVSNIARVGYADEMACQAFVTQCLNGSMSNNNPEQATWQFGDCTSKAEEMYPICAQVTATCETR